MALGFFLLVFGVDACRFYGRVLLVHGRGFFMIIETDAKPSGMLLAIDFRCNSFVTSVSERDVRRSRFMVGVF